MMKLPNRKIFAANIQRLFSPKRAKTSARPLLTFAIPWAPRTRCIDWSAALKGAEHNLHSIYSQKIKDHEILIGYCEEDTKYLPDFLHRYPVKLMPFPFTEDTVDQEGVIIIKDKLHKLSEMLKESSGEYHFNVDWDDVINRNLISYIKKNPSPYGYYLSKGYFFYRDQSLIRSISSFSNRCGSSHIIAFTDEEKSNPTTINFHHESMVSDREMLGRPLMEIDKRFVLYAQDHWSVSATMRDRPRPTDKRRLIRNKLKREFSFPK
ncbi:MAG: hypothetical protein AAF362_10220 [Pseudomonadota bacterium]